MFSGLMVTRAMRMNGVEALKEDMGGVFFRSALFFSSRDKKWPRENVFESNLCSLYVSLPLGDTDVNVGDRKT